MFVHPEIKQQFVIEKFGLHYAHPSWNMETVEEAALARIFMRNLDETTAILKELCFCPGLVHPVEEYERQLQLEEVLDEGLIDDEEDF